MFYIDQGVVEVFYRQFAKIKIKGYDLNPTLAFPANILCAVKTADRHEGPKSDFHSC